MKTKFRLKISVKITLGFALVLLTVLLSFYFIEKLLDQSKSKTENAQTYYTPSVSNIHKLGFLMQSSNDLIKSWVLYDKSTNSLAKRKLRGIHSYEYPIIKDTLDLLSQKWSEKDREIYLNLVDTIDFLISEHQEIMGQLNKQEKYNDSSTLARAKLMLAKVQLKNNVASELFDSLRIHSENVLVTSNNEMNLSFDNFSKKIKLISILIVFLIITITYLTARSLISPINYIKKIIISMGSGELPDYQIKKSADEIGQMGQALTVLVAGLKEKSHFALEIGKGNYDSKFIAQGQNDVLGNSLLQMRQSLQKASKEAATRRIENQERSWAAQGLAQFSEILIEHSESLEDFSNITISKLTKYLKASLGGLFILHKRNQPEAYLELLSFYAYDRQKFLEKEIRVGENLVGQCILENETIYLTDIPKGYVNITSGLGSDHPKSILIVPLKLNEDIYGIVELASFNLFEKYQIDFVEKIGETLASTIANIRINLQNAKLLEDSNRKSEELAEQEQESKKNIAELQANKAEMLRREQETKMKHNADEQEYLRKIGILEQDFSTQEHLINDKKIRLQNTLNAINNSVGTLEMTLKGEILNINAKYLLMAGITQEEILNRNIEEFINNELASSTDYQQMWKNLKKGIPHNGGHQYFFSGIEKWFYETFTPVKNLEGAIYKIIVLSHDISKVRQMERAYKEQIEKLTK